MGGGTSKNTGGQAPKPEAQPNDSELQGTDVYAEGVLLRPSGVHLSGLDSDVQVKQMADAYGMTRSQVVNYWHRFHILDYNQNGVLDANDLEDIPYMAEHPLLLRFLTLVSNDHSGCVTFPDFLDVMRVFQPETPLEDKLTFIYALLNVSDGNQSQLGQDLLSIFKHAEAELNQHTVQDSQLPVVQSLNLYCDDFVSLASSLDDIEQETSLSLPTPGHSTNA